MFNVGRVIRLILDFEPSTKDTFYTCLEVEVWVAMTNQNDKIKRKVYYF